MHYIKEEEPTSLSDVYPDADSTLPGQDDSQVDQIKSEMTTDGGMEFNPQISFDHDFKSDLFDLVGNTDLSDFTATTDFNLTDIVGRNNNNISATENYAEVLSPPWMFNNYGDQNLQAISTLSAFDKDKDSSDKMWGGGSTTERVINAATGNPIFITYSHTDHAIQPPDSSDVPHNPSPPMSDHNNLDLFHSMLTEKPLDPFVSHNHRSPASDCVSYASSGSAYSDSGFSGTTIDESSPAGNQGETVDFDRLVDSAVGQLVCSPGAEGGLTTEESGLLEGGYLTSGVGGAVAYIAPVSQNDASSILEGALRGTVRRPVGHPSTQVSHHKHESKTLTLMSNMSPLPPLQTAFKSETLGIPTHSQITSSQNLYAPAGYDYTTTTEDFAVIDTSFSKMTTAATSSTKLEPKQQKKRKYTKRGANDEPATKGRLLHFCPVCNKGFKDKYSVNVHLRTHTGEKPFNCELCGKSFRQKAHLAKHVQIHAAQKNPVTKR